jgi:hypothetical protein
MSASYVTILKPRLAYKQLNRDHEYKAEKHTCLIELNVRKPLVLGSISQRSEELRLL